MAATPQSVKTLLHSVDSELGTIVRQARYLGTVRNVILEVLPGNAAEHVHVADIDGHRLVLHTDSASWATRLRYSEPGICRALAQRLRVHTDKIVTRVRPDLARPEPGTSRRYISAHNCGHMRQVADYIDDPELARSLQRLADRATTGDSGNTDQAAATGRALT